MRCAAMPEVVDRCTPILHGPLSLLRRIAQRVGLPWSGEVIDVGCLDADSVEPGRFSAETGLASFQAVTQAIDATLRKEVDAIVTGPIQKEAWRAAGIEFPGHTELLAHRTGAKECAMMLTSDAISCVLATIHLPLADVASSLTIESVLRAIRLGADAAARKRRGKHSDGKPGDEKSDPSVRVTVCGLNPHAGEGGMFSHGEEANIISPAIQEARRLGIDAIGPLPPDTAFTPSQRQQTDVYVCMYHDQGLIPLKALAFDDAVNVTLGLPIVRTSVDHGTALDLAWKGTASHRSMLAAIRMAIDLC